MANAAGHLGANFSVPTAATTFMSTSSLAVGTWLITLTATVNAGSANELTITAALGTATAILEGCTASAVNCSGGAADMLVKLSFVATVTAAGTISFQAASRLGGGTVETATVGAGAANATGWTASQP